VKDRPVILIGVGRHGVGRDDGAVGTLWTTWKASPAAKGARGLRLPANRNARGRFASTKAGVTTSPVMRCARRWVERVVALQDRADYLALPKFLEVPLQHHA
jgi:hypothetical protein